MSEVTKSNETWSDLCQHGNISSSCPICKNPGKNTREFFSKSGELELDPATDPEFNIEKPEFKELDPGIKRILYKIDFELLRKIYSEIATKSGLDVNQINFIDKDQIASKSGEGEAVYNLVYNKLAFNPELYKALVLNEGAVEEKGGAEAIILQMLCHELVHATNRQVIIGTREFKQDKKEEAQLGYHHARVIEDSRGDRGQENSYRAFNEGLTEMLANRIAVRYLSSRNLADPEMDKWAIGVLQAPPDTKSYWFKANKPYTLYRALAEQIVKRLSQETGLDEEMVFNAVVRSQYEAQSLDDPELKGLLVEIFGKDFMQDLRRAEDTRIGEMLSRLKTQSFFFESEKLAASKPKLSLKQKILNLISKQGKKAA